MPLPFILAMGAATATLIGAVNGVSGVSKMKKANDTMKAADCRHRKNLNYFKEESETTTREMDELGENELAILNSFQEFSRVFEKIKNKPVFEEYKKEGVEIPKYSAEELKKVSIGAGVLLGGVGGAAIGTAGAFAAAGATTAAVMAVGTASTGTAIASLSGAAATNATLAAIGGGSLAAGGGGIALGTTILSAATAGVGILVGGIIFNITGSSLSDKAEEAWNQMEAAEKEIDKICAYMKKLSSIAKRFNKTLTMVNKVYIKHLNRLIEIVEVKKKTDWNDFLDEERIVVENTVLLVSLLYNMGKVKLVLSSKDEDGFDKINTKKVDESILNAEIFISKRGLGAML